MLHYLHWREKRRWGILFPCNLICLRLHKALIEAVLIWRRFDFSSENHAWIAASDLNHPETNGSWGMARWVTWMKARGWDLARLAEAPHSRQKGRGRANSRELLPHGKRSRRFRTHGAKKQSLFLPSKLNLVAQPPNLLLNLINGEKQTQKLVSCCTEKQCLTSRLLQKAPEISHESTTVKTLPTKQVKESRSCLDKEFKNSLYNGSVATNQNQFASLIPET